VDYAAPRGWRKTAGGVLGEVEGHVCGMANGD